MPDVRSCQSIFAKGSGSFLAGRRIVNKSWALSGRNMGFVRDNAIQIGSIPAPGNCRTIL